MPTKSANVKNEKQYERLKEKGMSKQRAARIANSPDASKHGGQRSEKDRTPSREEPRPRRRRPATKEARRRLEKAEAMGVHVGLPH